MSIYKDRFEPIVILDDAKNEVVAYANIYADELEDDSFWLGNLIVSPASRGRGASQYLLDVIIGKAQNTLKTKKLKLACHSTNSRGLAFYSKSGFKPFDMKIHDIGSKKFITIHMIKNLV